MAKIWNIENGECMKSLKYGLFFASVAFSYDSTLLAAGAVDRQILIWNTRNDQELRKIDANDATKSIAFARNSSQLAVNSGNLIRIYDASNGRWVQTLRGHRRHVTSLHISHDSTRLASASMDGAIKIWDMNDIDCLPNPMNVGVGVPDASHAALEGHYSRMIVSMAFSHDSSRLASAAWDDMTVKIWDSNGVCLQTLHGHENRICSVRFSHDSTKIASASMDCTARIWDADKGECLQTLKGHDSEVRSAIFSPDATRVASISEHGIIKVWDTKRGLCLCTFAIAMLDAIYLRPPPVVRASSVSWSPDATLLAAATATGDIKVWVVNSLGCVQTLVGHNKPVSAVAFSHYPGRVASTSEDQTAKVWDITSGRCLKTFNIGRILRRISFSTCGLYIHTDIGTIDISAVSDPASFPAHAEVQTPRYRGLGLSADCRWITYNSDKLVWIPADYRSSCSVVSGTSIGVGCMDGRVWICEASAALLESGDLQAADN